MEVMLNFQLGKFNVKDEMINNDQHNNSVILNGLPIHKFS